MMLDTATPVVSSTQDCGELPLDLQPSGVNIMIAVEGSAAMEAHWQDIATAIRSLRESNPTATFGVHTFWADLADITAPADTSTGMVNTSNNACGATHREILELGDHTGEALVAAMGAGPLGGADENYQVSSIIEPLSYYLENATTLSDPSRTNYLLVFTGGNENCFGSAFAGRDDKIYAYQKLAIELAKLNIRTVPIGVDPPRDPNAGPNGPIGSTNTDPQDGTAERPTTDYEVLKNMLQYGGSGIAEVPRIDTPENLQALVNEVGGAVVNCRFAVPATLDPNQGVSGFQLSFSINGVDVPRDRHQADGWDFVNNGTSEVAFFGQGCEALQAGQTVVAHKTCDQNVCGTAAVTVETKPRMVLFLLDGSLSRVECTDGSISCTTSLPGTPGRALAYWEVVSHAVASTVIAPVNDDVLFGIQFFPSKTIELLACDVAEQPEVQPGPAKQIMVIRSMAEKLPLGFSPVVAALEGVAAAPGMLVDPSVLGAVIMLTDGGDNCSGAMPDEIVARLGAAAKTLFDAGVRTYGIRYGSANSETAQQAAEMTAIVTNGGTALSGGAVAYVDAKSADELAMAMEGISDELASCSFSLNGEVRSDVDKDRTQLFLNGDEIGFDAKATKSDGWNWADPERTMIELFGPACSAFKSVRRPRIAVEFGCEPEVIVGPD